MIKIEIHAAEVVTINTIRGPMRKQSGYAYVLSRDGKPNPHPNRCEVILKDQQPPYAPGVYTLAPQSVYTDRYGGLALAPVLVPVQR